MNRIFKTVAPNFRRAMYLLQHGGPSAVIAALKRRRHLSHVQRQAVQVNPGSAPTLGGHDRLQEAAKLRAEEIVILAEQPFDWLHGHHRPAQLAQAALTAGHRVIYVCGMPAGEAETPLGMAHLHLRDLSVEHFFERLSERAVLINCLIDPRVLPLMRYARARGLRSYHDASVGDGDSQALESPLFSQFADLADQVCAASPAVAARMQNLGYKVVQVPAAVSHRSFDVYREYAKPTQFEGNSREKAMVFAPGGDALIDWDYLIRAADLNPKVAFFLLGLTRPPSQLPTNVIVLPDDCLKQVNAFIAHCDLVLAPIKAEALYADAAQQGILAGAFLNKPVISSQPFVFAHPDSLLHLSDPVGIDDLLGRSGPRHKNDLLVAEHSCLARLETLVPFTSHYDVSVVILIHNNASIISRCLKTLLRHCKEFIREVIVVDNASVDGGAEIVERQFPQVMLVRNPQNGCSSGRNLGVKHSTGKYLAFFDSDQWFTGGSGFAEALSILENHAAVGVIGWNAGWFDATRTDLGGMIADYCPNRAMNPQAITRGYRSDIGFLGTSGFFMRRATFDAIEGFDTFYDPTCFEDTDLCFQIRALGMEVSFRDLSGIRHQPHQTTGADSGSETYRKLFLRNANYFKEKWQAYPEFFLDYTA